MKSLEVEGVVSGYGEGDILHGVSLWMEKEEMVSIIGPNGAGKSTLLKTIVGLLRPRQGSIRFKGKTISGRKPAEISRLGICYVPQEENVFPTLTVVENLEMGAYIIEDGIRERVDQIYDIFPILRERRLVKAGTLSGGERQMLAMGMALMVSPELLILDEPSAGLGPNLVEEIFGKVQEINKAGVGILMVEQNAWKSLQIAHRAYILVMGRNRMEGTAREFLENPEIRESFLGK
jgi:ABC-type branched-subunit amino acid transport system ATPase component